MSKPEIIEDLTEEEKYLFAIFEDQSGVDLAEFTWMDLINDDGIFRLWPFQWRWYRDNTQLQIDHSGRSIGKTLSIQLRGYVFPFVHPGQEMLVTAPELNHLEQITTLIENRFLDTRLGKEMLVKDRSRITHKPFQAKFANGSRIIGRIPQRDGRGVKGCVGEGTIVLTDRGCIPVEQVEVGDRVWTHKQRWMPVLEVQEFEDEAFRIKGQGVFELIASEGHRFFGRRNRNGPKQKRDLASLQWAHVSDMENFYWASPVRFDESVPVPALNLARGEDVPMDGSFWWLVGRYLADGYLTSANGKSGKVRYRVNFCVHPDKQDEIEKRICDLGLHFRTRERDHSSANILEVSNAPWALWLEESFGRKNDSKTLPAFTLTLPESYRCQVLEGYLSGDGHFDEDRERWTASSASRGLIVGMKLLSQTLGWSATLSRVQPKVTEIMGVTLKSTPKLSWRLMISRKGTDLKIGEFSHARVKSVEPIGDATVYNVITEDHSYLTDGIVSHNTHPLWLEQDESQDYPEKGWTELLETLRRGEKDSMWRAHGVTRGLRDKFFYGLTTGANPDWKTHRYCLPAGTFVYGVDKPCAIEDVHVGDEVWTLNEFNELTTDKVTALVDNGVKSTWRVRVHGGFGLTTTPNHPYLILSREGTPRTRRELRLEWVEAQDLLVGDYVITTRELPGGSGQIPSPEEITATVLDKSVDRCVPEWVWGADRSLQLAFLNGYLMGDGSISRQSSGQSPWQVGTSSLQMAKELRALVHYLGFRPTNLRTVCGGGYNPETVQHRFEVYPDQAWYKQIPLAYSRVVDGRMLEGLDDHLQARRVLETESTGETVPTYDITVGNTHNYIAEGVVVHNTAIHRPTWNDKERRQKMDEYGGRDSPDYRRNILGEHGDSTSPVFVIHRLMSCVDDDQGSEYNTDFYYFKKISESWMRQTQTTAVENIDLPRVHLDKYKTFWCGMDVGWCVDGETEILTQDGWKFWSQVQEGDETISVDPVSGKSFWRKIENLHVFDERPRKMVHMKGQSFDAFTTPNHRWLVKGYNGELQWKTTETLNTKDRIPLTVERGDLPTEKVFEDEFIELMAWFWTEGTIVRSGGIEIGQSPEANPQYVERIRSSLLNLFGEPGKLRDFHDWHEKERSVRGFSEHRMTYFRLSQEVSRRFLRYAPDKVVSGEFLTQLTPDQLELFIEVSLMADGWNQDGYKIEQHNLERIKSFEMACALAGLSTSTSHDPKRDRWHLAILKSNDVGPVKSAQFSRKTSQAMTIEPIEYSGTIWCPVIEGSQNWLARRNGSVYFTGNTISPSEILVFAEEVMPKDEWKYYKKEGKSVPELQSVPRLRLITRLSLVRMSSPDQKDIIREVIRHYSPEAFSFDATGAGLNMFQDIMKDVEDMPELKATVKGYNFGGKILVDFDPTIEVSDELTNQELAKEAGIEMNTVLYATDKLRYLVDNGRLWLPWDTELIGQFQEGKYEATKGAQYGRKILKGPNSHTMDAARMAVLGWAQFGIEALMGQEEDDDPVLDTFMLM